MGSNKPHSRGKPQPQRRDKVKPAVQHSPQARSLAVSAQQAAPGQPAPHTQPRATPIAQKPDAPRPEQPPKPITTPAQTVAPPAKPITKPDAPVSVPAAPTPAPAPHGAAAPPASPPAPHAANGAIEPMPGRHITQHTPTPPSELTPMFEELRQLFAQDRAHGARPDAMRCGVCYLTYPRDELIYREQDGFYACSSCANSLGQQRLPMLRRQRK